MFDRIISTLRNLGGESSFDGYYREIHRHRHAGTPTIDEARRDFRDAISQRSRV